MHLFMRALNDPYAVRINNNDKNACTLIASDADGRIGIKREQEKATYRYGLLESLLIKS